MNVHLYSKTTFEDGIEIKKNLIHLLTSDFRFQPKNIKQ